MRDQQRIVFLDWLRVIACLMVMGVHSVEPFYLGDGGTLITCEANGFWSTIIDSALRASVPLFIMTSSYLLFPVAQPTSTFLRHRLTRVGWPLVVWVLLYAIIPLWGSDMSQHDIAGNLKHSALNFPDPAGHLWFMYMLIGVYIAMPIFSPWVDKLSKKGEQTFLALWLFTTTVPFWRELAMQVFDQSRVWGEAFWNEFGLLYYVSGFIGYVVLGHYFKKYVPAMSWRRTLSLALPLWLVGYAITAGWFWAVMPKSFPIHEPIELAVYMETSWDFCTLGVALTTMAYFLIARKMTADGWVYRHLIAPLSRLSFGMYLMHIFVLCFMFDVVSQWFAGVDAWTATPLVILLTALFTFGLSAILTKILSLIPGSRYFVGV